LWHWHEIMGVKYSAISLTSGFTSITNFGLPMNRHLNRQTDKGKSLFPTLTKEGIKIKSTTTGYRTNELTRKILIHLLESLGRPRTVLCHTMGKLTMVEKFCVTAIVWLRLTTTCHQPPGTNTVSPGFCRISSCKTGIRCVYAVLVWKLYA